jgi:hypothetical protein
MSDLQAKREELAKLQQQTAERKARIAKLQAEEKPMLSMDELLEQAYGPKPPEPPPLTEAQQKERWEKAEAARSEMQRNAPIGFDGAKLFPEFCPEQERWRLKAEVIPPESVEEVKRPVKQIGIGAIETVQFGPDSKLNVRVLSLPDKHNLVKCTPMSGSLVGHVIEISVGDFL